MFPWCEQARQLVGPGILEHSRLWRRLATAAARVLDFLRRGSHAGGVEEGTMEVLYPHCAGLDVHKDTVVACVRHMATGSVEREVRTFKTTTRICSPCRTG